MRTLALLMLGLAFATLACKAKPVTPESARQEAQRSITDANAHAEADRMLEELKRDASP